jgi:Asp-tRNA(Asn)/Glu-tRNA(Gln) amidotransferase A subunit family amidase
MMRGPFSGTTINEVAVRLRDGTTDSVALVEQVLDAVQASQPTLNAFVTVSSEQARRDALLARDELARGQDRGALHGIPIAVKDIVDTAGITTTMGSRHFSTNVPARDAEVVARLRAAGAVVVGKTTTHEFAFGPTGDRAANGPGANPHDPTRMAGGSSAGSAAAVGAGLVPLAVGTDTGGSVRIPAALCGVVGIRPSMGVIPTDGVFPLSWSLDTVGVLANDVAATAVGWQVLAGSPHPMPAPPPVETLRVGLVTGAWFERLDDVVRARFDGLAQTVTSQAAAVALVTVPDAEELRALYTTVQLVEALAIHQHRMASAPELFDSEVLQRLQTAVDVPAVAYANGLRQIAQLRATATDRLRGLDVLLLPTVPILAPPLGVRDADVGGGWTSPRDALLAHDALWGVLGLPALSIPVPNPDGLPVGAQLVGRPGADADLLAVAATFERLLSRG